MSSAFSEDRLASSQPPAPDPRRVWGAAVAIGVSAMLMGALFHYNVPLLGTDFNWAVRAARDLLNGADPYARPFGPNAIPYPFPAALIGVPFAPLPDIAANALFAGLASGTMAYALARTGEWWRLLVFLSPCYFMALKHVQWAPLLFAAVLLPGLAPVIAAKPTLGLVTAVATRWNARNTLLLVALVCVSFIVMPDWPWRWYPQTRSFYGFVPLSTLPGYVLILAVLRWREWRGRLLLASALIPQQVFFYDQLLLYHVPRTRRQLEILLVTGWLALIGALIVWDFFSAHWLITGGLYLPALVLLLNRPAGRANEGSVEPPISAT